MNGGRHVVVAGALVRGGRVLLCHRHPDRRWYPDVWDLPGGHVEPGETPADALRRELAEEVGVAAEVQGAAAWSTRTDEMDLAVWRVVDWQGEPTLADPAEHDELGWFTHAEAVGLDLADHGYRDLLEVVLRA